MNGATLFRVDIAQQIVIARWGCITWPWCTTRATSCPCARAFTRVIFVVRYTVPLGTTVGPGGTACFAHFRLGGDGGGDRLTRALCVVSEQGRRVAVHVPATGECHEVLLPRLAATGLAPGAGQGAAACAAMFPRLWPLDVGVLVAFPPVSAARAAARGSAAELSADVSAGSSGSYPVPQPIPAAHCGRVFTLSDPLDAPRPVDTAELTFDARAAAHGSTSGSASGSADAGAPDLASEAVVWCGWQSLWPLGAVATRCLATGRRAVWALRRLREHEGRASERLTGSSGGRTRSPQVPRGWRSLGEGDSVVRLATTSILEELEVMSCSTSCAHLFGALNVTLLRAPLWRAGKRLVLSMAACDPTFLSSTVSFLSQHESFVSSIGHGTTGRLDTSLRASAALTALARKAHEGSSLGSTLGSTLGCTLKSSTSRASRSPFPPPPPNESPPGTARSARGTAKSAVKSVAKSAAKSKSAAKGCPVSLEGSMNMEGSMEESMDMSASMSASGDASGDLSVGGETPLKAGRMDRGGDNGDGDDLDEDDGAEWTSFDPRGAARMDDGGGDDEGLEWEGWADEQLCEPSGDGPPPHFELARVWVEDVTATAHDDAAAAEAAAAAAGFVKAFTAGGAAEQVLLLETPRNDRNDDDGDDDAHAGWGEGSLRPTLAFVDSARGVMSALGLCFKTGGCDDAGASLGVRSRHSLTATGAVLGAVLRVRSAAAVDVDLSGGERDCNLAAPRPRPKRLALVVAAAPSGPAVTGPLTPPIGSLALRLTDGGAFVSEPCTLVVAAAALAAAARLHGSTAAFVPSPLLEAALHSAAATALGPKDRPSRTGVGEMPGVASLRPLRVLRSSGPFADVLCEEATGSGASGGTSGGASGGAAVRFVARVLVSLRPRSALAADAFAALDAAMDAPAPVDWTALGPASPAAAMSVATIAAGWVVGPRALALRCDAIAAAAVHREAARAGRGGNWVAGDVDWSALLEVLAARFGAGTCDGASGGGASGDGDDDDAWEALVASEHHRSSGGAGLLACLGPSPRPAPRPAELAEPPLAGGAGPRWARDEGCRVVACLHLLYEDAKLGPRGGADSGTGWALAAACDALATALGLRHWQSHYRRDMATEVLGHGAPLRALRGLSLPAGPAAGPADGVPPAPPCLRTALLETLHAAKPPCFPALRDGYCCATTRRLLAAYRALAESADPSNQGSVADPLGRYLRRVRRCVEAMAEVGLGPQRVAALPHGLALPLLQALSACRAKPPPVWSADCFALVGRPDLAAMRLHPDDAAGSAQGDHVTDYGGRGGGGGEEVSPITGDSFQAHPFAAPEALSSGATAPMTDGDLKEPPFTEPPFSLLSPVPDPRADPARAMGRSPFPRDRLSQPASALAQRERALLVDAMGTFPSVAELRGDDEGWDPVAAEGGRPMGEHRAALDLDGLAGLDAATEVIPSREPFERQPFDFEGNLLSATV